MYPRKSIVLTTVLQLASKMGGDFVQTRNSAVPEKPRDAFVQMQ